MIHFTLTAGQAHESTQAIFLLQGLNFKVVIADKAFDSKAIVDFVESKNGKVVIPSQRSRAVQRPIDQEQYRERNLIERFFCKAKEFRRLATRYEKLLERFASFILIVAGMLWA